MTCLLVATSITIGVAVFAFPQDDLPGKTIGPNPKNIPESQLPSCSFTGTEFVKIPCYSRPNSMYL